MFFSKEFPKKRLFTNHFISSLASILRPQSEITRSYPKTLKISFALSLFFFLIVINSLPKRFKISGIRSHVKTMDLVLENVPRTKQIDRPPPPVRPLVPIPTEDEEVPEDLTIEGTEIDFSELPPPPSPPEQAEGETYRFMAYDSPPVPIGGFASLLKHIKYPEIARRSGVECQVIVGVLVDTNGRGIKTIMLKDSGAQLGFEEAASFAVKQMRWKPALQRDHPIKVWVSVPVVFQLN